MSSDGRDAGPSLLSGTPPAQGDLPFYLAVDGTSAYWIDQLGGTVSKVPVGGGAVTLLASGQSSPSAIAVDGTSAYWTNKGGAIDGGTVVKLTLKWVREPPPPPPDTKK